MQRGRGLKSKLPLFSCLRHASRVEVCSLSCIANRLKTNWTAADLMMPATTARPCMHRPTYRPNRRIGTTAYYPKNFQKFNCGFCSLHSRSMSSLVESFPWSQKKKDKSKDDPIHHKFVGLYMLKRVLRNYAREEFNINEFITGFKQAVTLLAECVSTQDKDDYMSLILGPELHARFCKAFAYMKMEKKRVILEVEALRNIKITGVRTVCGNAEEGDEYIISFLGQKIITSKRDMFELENRIDASGYSHLFKYGKDLGMSAAQKQLRFQIDMKFTTNERFYVQQKQDEFWELEFGETDLVTSQHRLRFESVLDDYEKSNDRYPLSWKIVNIDFDDDDEIVDDGL